jgi:NOL1/NOP2/fmu family ribosome biogenesis protein
MKITESLTVLNSKEIKNITKQLEEQFGIEEKPDYVFLQNNKDKVYITTRDIERIDLESIRIDSIGLYFGKFYSDGFRLTIEGAQLIGPLCKKNVVDVTLGQKHDWLLGKDIPLEVKENCFVILKWNNDYLGCAKVKNGIALNSVPSARTLHVVNEQGEDELETEEIE